MKQQATDATCECLTPPRAAPAPPLVLPLFRSLRGSQACPLISTWVASSMLFCTFYMRASSGNPPTHIPSPSKNTPRLQAYTSSSPKPTPYTPFKPPSPSSPTHTHTFLSPDAIAPPYPEHHRRLFIPPQRHRHTFRSMPDTAVMQPCAAAMRSSRTQPLCATAALQHSTS